MLSLTALLSLLQNSENNDFMSKDILPGCESVPLEVKSRCHIPWAWATIYRCWDLNQSPLGEQAVLLTAEPSAWGPSVHCSCSFIYFPEWWYYSVHHTWLPYLYLIFWFMWSVPWSGKLPFYFYSWDCKLPFINYCFGSSYRRNSIFKKAWGDVMLELIVEQTSFYVEILCKIYNFT